MSSSSTSSDATKLFVTAVGAAIAGAALTFGITTYANNRKKDRTLAYYEKSLNISNNKPTTYIYEDGANSSCLDTSLNSKQTAVILPHNHEERMRRIISARASVEDDNAIPRRSVTVRVPATSANMGPGCTYYPRVFYIHIIYLKSIVTCLLLFVLYRHSLPLSFLKMIQHTHTHHILYTCCNMQTTRLAWRWICGVK
jgi:hypothetical protein